MSFDYLLGYIMSISMCMQNFITIRLSVQKIGPFYFFWIRSSAKPRPTKNVISQSLVLDLVNINLYAKVNQNSSFIFTFSAFEPRQRLGQSQLTFDNFFSYILSISIRFWKVAVYCSCCLCLYFGSAIMLVTYFVNFRLLNDHLFGKELFILFAASAFRKLSSVYVFSYFPFGFEGRIWDLIVSVPDHCLSFLLFLWLYGHYSLIAAIHYFFCFASVNRNTIT